MYLAQSVTNKRTCTALQSSHQGIAAFCWWNPVLSVTGFHVRHVCQRDSVSCNEDNCTSKIKDRKIKVQNSFQWNLMPKVIFYVSVSSAKLLWRVQSISKSRTWFWWFFFLHTAKKIIQSKFIFFYTSWDWFRSLASLNLEFQLSLRWMTGVKICGNGITRSLEILGQLCAYVTWKLRYFQSTILM